MQRGSTESQQPRFGRFLEQLTLTNRLLDRHLTDEEELIVPVILKYGAQDIG